MNITEKRYARMVSGASPKSRLLHNCLYAFFSGGLICTMGQALTDTFSALGADTDSSRCLTSITLIALAAAFTAAGWYDSIAKKAGAGTLVPITGFSNAVAAPAAEFLSEGAVAGMGAKMFVIAGPVIVYGTAASILYGLALCIAGLSG